MLEKLNFVTNLPDPDDQEVKNLKEWVRGTGFDRMESSYIGESDLASFSGSNDRAVKVVEAFLERKTASLYDSIGKVSLYGHFADDWRDLPRLCLFPILRII